MGELPEAGDEVPETLTFVEASPCGLAGAAAAVAAGGRLRTLTLGASLLG